MPPRTPGHGRDVAAGVEGRRGLGGQDAQVTVFLIVNLALRFLLELCALLAVAYWGFRTGSGASRIAFGVGAPLVLARAWSMFGSPRAAISLPGSTKLLFELHVFGAAAVALVAAGRPTLAWTFAALLLANKVLMSLGKH